MAREYRVISADSHLDINPDVWNHRVPAQWRDRAPRRVKMENGSDAVVVDGGKPNTIGITRSVGVSPEEIHTQVPTFETGAGTGPPEQRLQEQDRDGVDAEVMFSQIHSVLRQAKEDDFYLALVRAYNEYLAEEYRAPAPDRLIPLAIIPTTGLDDAVAELEHCARLGFKGVALTSFPNGRGYPTSDDDRFWAAALDLSMPLAKHGGGRFIGKREDPPLLYPQMPSDPDMHKADAMQELYRWCGSNAAGAMQMAYAGVYDRFPTLEMYWAETMAGWIKYAMWQMDDSYRRYRHMMRAYWALDFLERQPSDYIKNQNYWGFLYDPVGVQLRDCIGADKLMWASDFAHAASDWPNSRAVIEEIFAGVPEDEKYAMLAGNAVRYWRLDERQGAAAQVSATEPAR